MAKISTVRTDRTLTRAGLWATGPRQLTLPINAKGLSEVLVASGALSITPDYDILCWLCERWLRRPTESGWMRPTLYELGSDLYGGPPSGKHYRTLIAALDRIGMVTVEIMGFDAETGEATELLRSRSNLGEFVLPGKDPAGIDRFKVRLAEWLRREIDHGAPLRLSWRTLRAFDENQKLAKRLWIYLCAESWKRFGDGTREATWLACGDRLEAALGMDYDRPRDARAALKRACQTILRTDPRMAGGYLDVVKVGRAWRIEAQRLTFPAWQQIRGEQEQVRQAIRESLESDPAGSSN